MKGNLEQTKVPSMNVGPSFKQEVISFNFEGNFNDFESKNSSATEGTGGTGATGGSGGVGGTCCSGQGGVGNSYGGTNGIGNHHGHQAILTTNSINHNLSSVKTSSIKEILQSYHD